MIRILHMGKFYPPDHGGIESVTKTIVESSSKEFEHTVICFSKKKEAYYTHKDNIIRCKILFYIKNQPISFRYLYNAIRKFKTADIIHVHCPNVIAYVALLFCFGKKIVIHWHSDILNKGLLYKLVKPLEQYVINKSDKIIVTSLEYFNYSEPLKKFSNKVNVIPLGVKDVEKERLSPQDSVLSSKFDNHEIILSIGRLVNYKGHELLLHASKYFSDNIATVIVGTGPEREHIFSLIKDNNIKNVCIIENANDDYKYELYRRCKIFCLSSISRQEAFGVVLLEALCFGKPLLVNEISGSGMNWINKNQHTGLNFDMRDSKRFANIVNSLVKDDNQLSKYSTNSRDRYNKLFTDKIMKMKIEEVYFQLFRRV